MSLYQYGPASNTIPQPPPQVTTAQVGAPPPTSATEGFLPDTGFDNLALIALGIILFIGGVLLSGTKRKYARR